MNDMTQGTTTQLAGGAVLAVDPIVPGQIWQRAPAGPWSEDQATRVRVIDCTEGWVRYWLNTMWPDERATEETFRTMYRQAGSGVQRSIEDAIRERFVRFATSLGYGPSNLVRDRDGCYSPDNLQSLWVGFRAGFQGIPK